MGAVNNNYQFCIYRNGALNGYAFCIYVEYGGCEQIITSSVSMEYGSCEQITTNSVSTERGTVNRYKFCVCRLRWI
jgi:hypothetical protein